MISGRSFFASITLVFMLTVWPLSTAKASESWREPLGRIGKFTKSPPPEAPVEALSDLSFHRQSRFGAP